MQHGTDIRQMLLVIDHQQSSFIEGENITPTGLAVMELSLLSRDVLEWATPDQDELLQQKGSRSD